MMAQNYGPIPRRPIYLSDISLTIDYQKLNYLCFKL